MKHYYSGVYGETASVTVRKDGTAKLIVKTSNGATVISKVYRSWKGAKIAMGKCSDGWTKRQ